MHRWLLVCATLLLGPPCAAAAGQPVARIVADVMIDGRGPFHFMLDTGATRAILSESTGSIPARCISAISKYRC